MNGIIVALPNNNDLANELGKKGGSNGISFFHRKIGDTVITFLTPTDLNGKYYAVAQSILLSDVVLLSSKTLDALFGEVVIAASLLHKRLLITKETEVSSVLKDSRAEYELVEKDKIIDALLSIKGPTMPEGFTRIDIDRSFPVNGVGDVALGLVVKGKISKHSTLFHNSGKEVTIRSIQILDEDVDEAGKSARVGVALKGISYKEIEKGDTLASKQIAYKKTINASLVFSSFYREQEQFRCTFVHNFSVSIASLKKQENMYAISLEKGIAVDSGDEFLLIRDEQPRIFASGKVL